VVLSTWNSGHRFSFVSSHLKMKTRREREKGIRRDKEMIETEKRDQGNIDENQVQQSVILSYFSLI